MARPRQADLIENALSESGEILTQEEVDVKLPKIVAETEPESYTFEQIGDFPIVDGVKKFPASFTLPNTDVVKCPKTGKQRSIRYLMGVPTIWEDEQGEIDKTALKRLTPKRFQLTDGKLVVDKSDKAQLEFLMLSNYNEATKDRVSGKFPMYRLVDNRSKEEASLKFLKAAREASGYAESAPEEDMKIHASYLGIQDYNNQGQPKSMSGLRADYIKYAMERPSVFMKSYKNPLAKAFVQIRDAIQKGIISLTHVKGQAHWDESKALIAVIPEGKAEVEFLANYALTSEGKSFKERLAELL